MIFMPGRYRRTRADIGRIIAGLEAILTSYPARTISSTVRPGFNL
jgi:hypothetical protein